LLLFDCNAAKNKIPSRSVERFLCQCYKILEDKVPVWAIFPFGSESYPQSVHIM